MNANLKKVTAVFLAVIFLVGILPYTLTKIFKVDNKKKDLMVRVAMKNNQISKIPLEEYLIGVVAAEMPAEFEVEALKAQAVAARTYVLKKMGDSRDTKVFDVDTSEQTQAWNSAQDLFQKWGVIKYFKYHRKIAEAVRETQGRILTYNGQIIDAVYHSSSGRKGTERAGDVWSGESVYLTNVSSGETNPLRFVKQHTFDVNTFYTLLDFSSPPARFESNDLIVIERTKGGRIKTLAVRNRIFEGTDFRARLELPSTDFEWRTYGNKIELVSYGKGHGVGMSQYGANDLAKAGKKYPEILGHYYQGTKLEKAY